MSEFLILFPLLLFLLGFGFAEYILHISRRNKIPVRIHVNGTRGKSSVTRLIASGLKEGGFQVLAKTTGTVPRLILPDGSERNIIRYGAPNILEQKFAIQEAVKQGANVIVLECMALVPFNQKVSEEKLIKATHSVITNVREDHLEIMGPEKKDVALALSGFIPKSKMLFTSEVEFFSFFEEICKRKNTEIVSVSPKKYSQLNYMQGFAYYEHPENVLIALEVCESLGVKAEIAIQGMWSHSPDLGATFFAEYTFGENKIAFANGFAANDPRSAASIWKNSVQRFLEYTYKVALVNCRKDRPERSEQMAKEILSWNKNIPDLILITGEGNEIFKKTCLKLGLGNSKLEDLKYLDAKEIMEFFRKSLPSHSMVVGLGNIGGLGLELLEHLKRKEILKG
ncbi:poly-gamma-glutamate synthase PgsB [Leptospira hartskeerlii]|uniref:Poly-gamma-glutamate synthase PgsB n=1 Tax=Leptospira hartskeerlii TaxID=2023177 RepID=A0A2M9XF77_9LEPT|nr:poly-gamma-glutamate synthase PgsB [Leptospira hartskeerlii]PJZ26333.1 poly-gamma-glutamate synthase PgsB [Leptospira hartskeerlii]PJZ34418.1 poly-gamma-glutamate synthase PgsB [Leptospira hartskeerlii]